jgi:hypothetical protein
MRATKLWHRRAVALLGAVLAVAPPAGLRAQVAAPAQAEARPERVAKVLRVRPGDANHVAALVGSFGVSVQTSDRLGLITLSGDAADVRRAEQAVLEIQALSSRAPVDAASDVDLMVHLIGIADQDEPASTGPVREVVAELKKTFPFAGYKLLETIALRARVGENAEVTGFLPEDLGEETPPKQYTFGAKIDQVGQRGSVNLVRFQWVRTSIRMPIPNMIKPGESNFRFEDIGINTALEIADGKTVVVGKVGSTGASRGYLLVLTAKVVN